jgi:hypothetical protein
VTVARNMRYLVCALALAFALLLAVLAHIGNTALVVIGLVYMTVVISWLLHEHMRIEKVYSAETRTPARQHSAEAAKRQRLTEYMDPCAAPHPVEIFMRFLFGMSLQALRREESYSDERFENRMRAGCRAVLTLLLQQNGIEFDQLIVQWRGQSNRALRRRGRLFVALHGFRKPANRRRSGP